MRRGVALSDLKMLALDIETKPGTAYFFDVWNTNIGSEKVITYPEIMAFSAQWRGKKKVLFYSEYHDGRKEMLTALRDLLDEADLVVTYNGDKFDLPWIEGEFIAEKMTPPSPVLKVDLLKVIRKHSRWVHKNLNTVVKRLLDEEKVAHPGFSLWRDCIEGDPKAWALMKKYAIKDTALLWPLFDELLPWIKMPHPVTDRHGLVCRNCGGTHFQRRGMAKTLQGEYPRYQCQDCGTWARGVERTPVGDTRNIAG
jgi:DNA polymerase elongation subunit (family B)